MLSYEFLPLNDSSFAHTWDDPVFIRSHRFDLDGCLHHLVNKQLFSIWLSPLYLTHIPTAHLAIYAISVILTHFSGEHIDWV